MTTEPVSASKPRKRRTWKDWAAPNAPEQVQLLSRDELIEELRARGADVTNRDLLYWQNREVIPYPIRIRVDSTSVARYPPWMIDLVLRLRHLQAEGWKLQRLRPVMRQTAEALSSAVHIHAHDFGTATGTDAVQHIVAAPTAPAHGEALAPEVKLGRVHQVSAVSSGEGGAGGTLTVASGAPAAFRSLADAFARSYEERYGVPISRVAVHLLDDGGNPVSFTFETGD